jgi:hypothetical protein
VVIGQAGFKCVHNLLRQADCPQCRAAAEGRDAGVCAMQHYLFVSQIFAYYSPGRYLQNIRETNI